MEQHKTENEQEKIKKKEKDILPNMTNVEKNNLRQQEHVLL